MLDREQGSFRQRHLEVAHLDFPESGLCLSLEQTAGEEHAAETMQSAVWSAGVALARAMGDPAVFPKGYWNGLHCIELGAGCGAVGLMAGKLGAQRVLLTDYPELLPLLSRNATRNGLAERVLTSPLEWGEASAAALASMQPAPCNVLLGGDITAFPQSLAK